MTWQYEGDEEENPPKIKNNGRCGWCGRWLGTKGDSSCREVLGNSCSQEDDYNSQVLSECEMSIIFVDRSCESE